MSFIIVLLLYGYYLRHALTLLCLVLPYYPCIVGALADGAVLEGGSNASGRWIKYANGTMECYAVINVTLSLAVYSNLYSSPVYAPYPVKFTNDDIVTTASVAYPLQSPWCTCQTRSDSEIVIRVLDVAPRSGNFIIQWRAIGRWKE